jgi:23S rRNA (cytidine1920-2'-O)/16S rRNA (cytidine1409-2'-O)-methyltransferase
LRRRAPSDKEGTMQANSPARLRLDERLVRDGHYASRSRARDAIARGAVSVDGVTARKAGQEVNPAAQIELADPASRYVSRAALKLIAGLDAFGFDPAGRLTLDLGASTGGFTQVLLERGARRVVAVDVGHGQMDRMIASDPRVQPLQGVNARDLTLEIIGGEPPEIIVSDVSFISLKLALPLSLDLAAPGATGVFLVKPQFEAGREAIGKGGLLRDPDDAPRVAEELRAWLDAQPGWRAIGLVDSPVLGGDGNREFLLGGMKDR